MLGFWIGGFAVQSGGMGDSHAALMQPPDRATASALDYELGFHHWGLMGSSGFFLASDDDARNSIAALFLAQAAMVLIVIAAALGAGLERAKVLSMVFCAYLIGFLIYPLFANWAWGGGWLAQLGRELHLGNGFVDPGGCRRGCTRRRASSPSCSPSFSVRATAASAATSLRSPFPATTCRILSSAR